MKTKQLALIQLDTQLQAWNDVKNIPTPQNGWLKTIRSALGMSTRNLARRLAVNQSRIIQIEKAEQNGSITLKTLSKTAEALNCKLVYAVVPENDLTDILQKQAKRLAKQRLKRVSHTMLLEGQNIDSNSEAKQLQELEQELLNQPSKKLWQEEE